MRINGGGVDETTRPCLRSIRRSFVIDQRRGKGEHPVESARAPSVDEYSA